MIMDEVMFAGGYKCNTPSVVKAFKASDIEIVGIADVVKSLYSTRIYPRGRLCCGKCGEWVELDNTSKAWAIRQPCGSLVCPKLVCEDCADTFQGVRYATLAQEDFYVVMRRDAKNADTKAMIKKWQKNAMLRKERREFALKSALVFKGLFENYSEDWKQTWFMFMKHI
jgi:hypothetical protein